MPGGVARARRKPPRPGPVVRKLDPEDLLLLRLELFLAEDALVLQLGELLQLGGVVRLGRRRGLLLRGVLLLLGLPLLLLLRRVLLVLVVPHRPRRPCDDGGRSRRSDEPRASAHEHLSLPPRSHAFAAANSRAAWTTSCGSRANSTSSPPAARIASVTWRAHTFSHTTSEADDPGSKSSAAAARSSSLKSPPTSTPMFSRPARTCGSSSVSSAATTSPFSSLPTNVMSMMRIVPASTRSARAGAMSPVNWFPGNAMIA